MTLAATDVADRVEIAAVLGAFARAANTGDMARLDALLTDDAVIDASALGGAVVTRHGVGEWLDAAIAPFGLVVMIVGDVVVDLEPGGTTAEVEHTWHGAVVPADASAPRIVYGVTLDRFVRTDDGWRIARREPRVGITVEMVAPDA